MSRLGHWFALGALGLVATSACESGEPEYVESNTNWMRFCSSDVDCGDLSCECGVCTEPCDSNRDCAPLGTSATCAAGVSLLCDSAETLCVPECERDADCSGDATCRGNVCLPRSMDESRAPDAGARPNVYVCPGGIGADAPDTDALEVTGLSLDGDTLRVDVRYGGGCEQHDFGLCYNELLGASAPPYVGAYIIHDDHDDTCEALLTDTLTFDLKPVADSVSPEGGLVRVGVWHRDDQGDPVNAGEVRYHWGDLSCGDRSMLAYLEMNDALRQADTSCTTAEDCQWVDVSTECTQPCDALVSTSGAGQLASDVKAIDDLRCSDFAADGCESEGWSTCATQSPMDCVNGRCERVLD